VHGSKLSSHTLFPAFRGKFVILALLSTENMRLMRRKMHTLKFVFKRFTKVGGRWLIVS
jgi:hypothetical protein